MSNMMKLDPFIGKVVTDITEHVETDQTKNNRTYIQVMFDDSSWIKFPQYDERFWCKFED